jgi:nitrogen fixation protein NifZ
MIDQTAPKFHWGQAVSAAADLYNDGSYPEAPVDALLVEAGAKGEIIKIGKHVESNTHVYLVEFKESIVVGCFEGEINPLEPPRPE